jgi:hypothetical protein
MPATQGIHKNIWLFILLAAILCQCRGGISPEHWESPHDLVFEDLAGRWDEGIPLGNGVLGALIWGKEGCLRMSLDRIDLWDLRLQEEIHGPEHTFMKFTRLGRISVKAASKGCGPSPPTHL